MGGARGRDFTDDSSWVSVSPGQLERAAACARAAAIYTGKSSVRDDATCVLGFDPHNGLESKAAGPVARRVGTGDMGRLAGFVGVFWNT